VRRGCGKIGESKSIICDIDKEVRWYVINSGGLKGFCGVRVKV